MWLIYDWHSRAESACIATPALAIVGDRVEFHPIEATVRLYRCLPKAELAILPGSSHVRPIFEPANLVPVLFDFIDRQTGTAW